jgi:hypothetical protein
MAMLVESARRRWMGRWHHSQPDYIMAWEGNIWYFQRVAF